MRDHEFDASLHVWWDNLKCRLARAQAPDLPGQGQGGVQMNDEWVDVSITAVDGVVAVTLGGEIDAHTAPRLQWTLDQVLDPRMRIVVNLSGVTFLDSRGLQVLLLQTERFREGGGRFEITKASPRVQRVVDYARLRSALDTGEERTTEAC